jgi:hypothetical protein
MQLAAWPAFLQLVAALLAAFGAVLAGKAA